MVIYGPLVGRPGRSSAWHHYRVRNRMVALLVPLFVLVGCGESAKSATAVATIASTVQAPNTPTSSPASTVATPTTVAAISTTTTSVQPIGDQIDNSSGWVAVESNNVVFLSWIEVKGQLTGTVQIAALSKGQVTPMNRSFSGQHVGKQVSLNIEGLGVWQGTLDGPQLTLRVPQNDGMIGELLLTKGGIDRYNTAVRALQGGAAEPRLPPTRTRNWRRLRHRSPVRSQI
jgi:hypothetical protein